MVFGLTPVAARGLIGLVAELLLGWHARSRSARRWSACSTTSCGRGSPPVDLAQWGALFEVAASWYRCDDFDVVQLIYPDRNGFLPYEAGFDQRMRYAQPVIGIV